MSKRTERDSTVSPALRVLGITAVGLLVGATACDQPQDQSDEEQPAQTVEGVDLGISDDETYGRPNAWSMKPDEADADARLAGARHGPSSRPGVSIAWRNAAQIEEVEVRVRNRGNQAGEGRVWVDILDDTGRILLHLEPPEGQKVIRVPAADRGGREGKVLRMSASRELNNLIDRYDRQRVRYHVRATVETQGEDANLFDNSKTKSWNIPFRVQPGEVNVFNYVFQNHHDEALRVRWEFEHTQPPEGWEVEGVPEETGAFEWRPGEKLEGTLLMRAPESIDNGAFLESRLSLVDDQDGSVVQQREWFQVYDTVPPHVSNYRMVFTADHRIAIQLLAADEESGILEATGVTTQYSTDGGKTWSERAHNYKAGNFVRPTLFEAVLGPFAPGTPVQLRMTVLDTGGNSQSTIPRDAVALAAPEGAESLLDTAYVFPRTQPNPIFAMENLEEARSVTLDRISAPGDELLEVTTIEVVVP